LVIISSKYIVKSVGERGQPWRTPLLTSVSFDDLELNFIDILFCVRPLLPLIMDLEYFWILGYQIKYVFVHCQTFDNL
jgi:hypothetical protein